MNKWAFEETNASNSAARAVMNIQTQVSMKDMYENKTMKVTYTVSEHV